MPGPPKTPTALLSARGSWRAKTRTDEPEASGSPRKPAWLTGVAADMWKVLVKQLSGMGVAGSVDTNALARYCQIYQRWRECEEYIEANGMVDDHREYPQVGRASRLADQLLKLEQQFGMTPSARASLGSTVTPKDKDKGKDGKQRFFNPKLTG